jgi:L-ascorbate 6-phosphate lactonase
MKSRQVPPLLKPEELTNASAILGTHDHVDHIDRACWPAMAQASAGARLIVPRLVRDVVARDLQIEVGRMIGLEPGETVEIDGVRISAVPAAHELLHQDPSTGLHPFVGYVLEGNGCCVYHAGDTCLYEGIHGWLRRWKFDVAFLPINGRDAVRYSRNCIGNMTYQEAADLAGSIQPRLSVPTHFEMFATNSENPQLFIDYMKVKWSDRAVMIPRHGDRQRLGPWPG